MYALDTSNGSILWTFLGGGSHKYGAAVADGTVFWVSGDASGFKPANTAAEYFHAFRLPSGSDE